MSKPVFWLIAGPNGAGKTTLVNRLALTLGFSPEHYINPDAVTLEYLKGEGVADWKSAPQDLLMKTFIRAAEDSEKLLRQRLENGETAVIETVLSTSKYLPVVDRVNQLGGRFSLIYVLLHSPDLSQARVRHRFATGGHDVPADKLVERWRKSLELLPQFCLKADRLWIFDNSRSVIDEPATLVATGSNNRLTLHGIPNDGARPLMAEFIQRFTLLDTERRWKLDLGDPYHS